MFAFVQCRPFSGLRAPSIPPRRHTYFVGLNALSLPSQAGAPRSLSLGSIFSAQTKPVPTPTPSAIGAIARLEADANAHPRDTSKQLALFEALIDTQIKAGYDVVITRWERMSEFVRPTRYLRGSRRLTVS